MSALKRAKAIVCYSDGCPEHEPPEDDCIECARAFWGPRLKPPPDLIGDSHG